MTTSYYFIGIKGSGMSALALILHQMGHKVQGSDTSAYCFTQRSLEKAGVLIRPFDRSNITSSDHVFIVGNAFQPSNNDEIAYLEEQGIAYQRYHEFLGNFMKDFVSLGVAGAHGKTSTTGLLAHVMRQIAKTNVLIGDGTGQAVADADYLVFESDEYKRHFMPYHPEYSIITNIDFDHPDYFTSLEDVFNAFNDYAKQVNKGLFLYGEDEQLRRISSPAPIYYYGYSEGNDFVAYGIERSTKGSTFNVSYRGEELGHFAIPTFGQHNVMNATAVIANLYIAGFDLDLARQHLMTFPGVKRRFSEKIINDTVIIDDFAHHPTEIVATIDAARQKYPDKEIVAVFQPHTFTRIIALLDEFAEALDLADVVYLAQIYGSARESDNGEIKAEDLSAKVSKSRGVITVENVSPLLDHEDAVYVFMGAGDIETYEHSFEDLLSQLTNNVQ